MAMVKKTPVNTLPPIPSLPETTVNPQPRNEESPVKPTVKRLNENGKTGVESEKMTKADWNAKDKAITVTALIKSVLESPVVAQMTHGKDDDATLRVIERVFKEALFIYTKHTS